MLIKDDNISHSEIYLKKEEHKKFNNYESEVKKLWILKSMRNIKNIRICLLMK